MNNLRLFIAIFILLVVSAFFSGAEIAFAGLNILRLKSRENHNGKKAVAIAIKIAENYDNTLGAILMGNNLANTAASACGAVIVLRLLGDNFAWVSTLAMTLLVLIFGEIIPKVLAKQFSENFAVAVAYPLYIISLILKPLTLLFLYIVKIVSKLWSSSVTDTNSVSEDDLENIIDIVEDEGVLDEEQCDLLQNALDFDNVLAYEIITPRVDMEAIDIHDPYEKNIQKLKLTDYSRIPVYEDTPDNIIGILHLNRFYKEMVEKPKVNIREMLLGVVFVHKTMSLPDVLEKMKESNSHMVVVLDEYGGTMGILTMEDVLEQLVGEIWDETDEIEHEFICIDDNHFEADGDMRLDDFFDEFDIDVEAEENIEEDNTTIGGWVVTMLDGQVKEGDSFRFENLIFTVKESDGIRIEKLTIEKLAAKENESD
ncbi:MAG: HlyC/CorC family transporter [Clostridia bacterium]|nr:HlyC/CorC family transporter [Clostridia bacterium]